MMIDKMISTYTKYDSVTDIKGDINNNITDYESDDTRCDNNVGRRDDDDDDDDYDDDDTDEQDHVDNDTKDDNSDEANDDSGISTCRQWRSV